jgi:hypothetical protein
MRAFILLLALATALPLRAQFSYPASASVAIGFIQLADGGPPTGRWTTTFSFTNPNTTFSTDVAVSFYDNDGHPLPLDFGGGPSTTLHLTLPPGGTRSVTSTGTSSTTDFVVGWAIALSQLPITGVALYRSSLNGTPTVDVAAVGTGATFFYSSYANENLGIAVVNPDQTRSLHLRVQARDANGADKGHYDLPALVPYGHAAFVLRDVIPGVLPSLNGSITITPLDDPPLPFAAWSVNARDNLLSPLPPGEMTWPGPYLRRHIDVARIAQLAAVALIPETDPYLDEEDPDLIVGYLSGISFDLDPSTTLKAYYDPAANQVRISTGLLEALGASDAALAFVAGHMVAHGILSRTGVPPSGPFAGDPELLADSAAEAVLLEAGFDPGGATDFYARLLYADVQGLPIDAALRTEFAIPNGIPNRLQKLWGIIQSGCGASGELNETCQKARKYWHPHNPVAIP